jgi:ATP-dependent DNA helicase UvrD/PcrA
MSDFAAPSLLDGLNPAQLDAVVHVSGPLLVVAGAGSGKTRVLTTRIAHLIREHNVSPFEILAITFTNKAAEEMRDRVAAIVGPVAEKMWVSTFHSACVRILRRDAHLLGYPSAFSIYDQADAVRLTTYVLRDLNLDAKRFPPRTIHALISAAKNELITPEEYTANAENIFERKIADVYTEYQQRLLKAGAMDFDDLLGMTVALFRKHPEVLRTYQTRFKHVMVDEYQDTNRAQNEIVLQLASEHGNICVVGDSDQSIYQFRGADVRNILEFEDAFPECTVVVLDQNYRSTQTILDAANAVIAKNFGRKPKDLWTDQGFGEKIQHYQADDESDESAWVVDEITKLHETGEFRWNEVAVFYRTNAQSRVLEERLVLSNVPYKVLGGTRFYDRKEIKDAIAYLRVVVNPGDEVSLKRVLNTPKRGIGDTSVGKIDSFARAHGYTFFESLSHASEAGVAGKALKGIDVFSSLIAELQGEQELGPGRLLQQTLERSGYMRDLESERSIEAEGRLENIAELVGTAGRFETIEQFLEEISLVSDTDKLDDDSQVVLMTMHSAKGLEYPYVFILGMEDGVFPHNRALSDPDQLEEERRLCYVGITRARERLYLVNAWNRTLFGQTQYNPPSRFLAEIPEVLIESTGQKRGAGRPSANWGSWGGAGRGGSSDTWGSNGDAKPGGVESGMTIRERREAREVAREEKREATLSTGSVDFNVGDGVVHAKFGEGVIISAEAMGGDAMLLVNFADGVGEKTLMAGFAKLEKA